VTDLIRTMQRDGSRASRDALVTREWLVTNGLGGYASGTVSGAISRRYHGLLVAALPAPLGRVMLFNHLAEQLRFHVNGDLNDVVTLGSTERAGGQLDLRDEDCLIEFRLEWGLPVWTYNARGFVFEKRILMPHGQNTVHICYRALENKNEKSEKPPTLILRPAFHFRRHETPVNEGVPPPYPVTILSEQRCEISAPRSASAQNAQRSNLPPLRLKSCGGKSGRCAFHISQETIRALFYRIEESRGYPDRGDLWSPGFFEIDFDFENSEHGVATLIASTEPWDVIDVLSPREAAEAERQRRARLLHDSVCEVRNDASGFAAELVFASDQFVITPAGRAEEAARAHAAGDEVRTIIAGYHWFTDWGRDTMISLEGLTVLTGRAAEAKFILHTFSHYVRDGLIPNMFPEGEKQKGGLYNTADATLWFFHALKRYLDFADDPLTLKLLLPILVDIVEHHLRGTDFQIRVDPADGLLSQGQNGLQLTWMDAKAGDWVVTPRRGKAVEINALWFNALSLLIEWLRASGDAENEKRAEHYEADAQRVKSSLNKRFWNAERECLFDVVDCENGEQRNDPAIRPNQIFSISLPHPVLDRERWQPVLEVVEKKLLTPVGLRSLSPDDPDYKPTYHGDRKTRDAAYHQGTVWPWLIGPFIDAWLRVHPDEKNRAQAFLERFRPHLDEAGIGTISEVFDAEEPHIPRGCIAQAWSVAELLRAWVKTQSP